MKNDGSISSKDYHSELAGALRRLRIAQSEVQRELGEVSRLSELLGDRLSQEATLTASVVPDTVESALQEVEAFPLTPPLRVIQAFPIETERADILRGTGLCIGDFVGITNAKPWQPKTGRIISTGKRFVHIQGRSGPPVSRIPSNLEKIASGTN